MRDAMDFGVNTCVGQVQSVGTVCGHSRAILSEQQIMHEPCGLASMQERRLTLSGACLRL